MEKVLVIDLGNTNMKLGLYFGDELKHSWRMSVQTQKTSDEIGITLDTLFKSFNMKLSEIDGVILSSVVPSLTYTIEHACLDYIHKKPLIVGPGIKTGIDTKAIPNPHEIGSDRIVNCVAAYNIYGGNCITIDFGTATTYNILSKNGEILGGLIAPGIKTSLESLVLKAAKLSLVELNQPKTAIGTNTETNLQGGIIYGAVGQVEYIVKKIKEELNDNTIKVIATGGLSNLITQEKKDLIDITDKYLTLKGLKIIYDLNTKRKKEK